MSAVQPQLAPPVWLRLPRRTARMRFTALYGALFLLSGAVLVVITYALFERATEFRTPSLPKVPHTPAIQALPQLLKVQSGLLQAQFQLQGLPVPTAAPNPLGLTPREQLVQVEHQLQQDQHELAHAEHQLAQSVHQLAQAGTVQAAQRAADSHQLLVNSGIALAIVAILALAAGWFVAGRMLRPIRTITRTARRISATNLHERLALDGPKDELKELGDTLDGLFARLEAAFAAQRHFVANASHELRTPLTAERALLQVALEDPDMTTADWRSTAAELLASSDEQARLIESLLTLASSETGLTGCEPVDLATAVAVTLIDLRPEIDHRQIHVADATEPAPLNGDPVLVQRLVANLLSNAVRHNSSGGLIEITTGVNNGRAVLSVTNTGPLIPPAEVGRLFQPFQRLDRRRANYKDGHGLGLSIVRAIVTTHDATITARSVPDGGLFVRVSFPAPASRIAARGDRSYGDAGLPSPQSLRQSRKYSATTQAGSAEASAG